MKKIRTTWIPDNDTFFPAYFERDDVFERGNLETALKFVRNWNVAVDGGAHVGSWARHMATMFRDVYAYEPQADNFECLKANCGHIENVHCNNVALGKMHGEIAIAPGNNGGCWHQVPGSGVRVIPLPDLGALDFLKLDIEGFEAEVVEGAMDLIDRYRPVVLIEEKHLPHKPLDYKARRLLEIMDYREVARSGRDVIFA